MKLKSNAVILFQGDSITDAGRDRADFYGNAGYPAMIARILAERFPERSLTCLNRGVSGDTSAMMLARWEEDCLALKPDVLSVLIGINDTWRRYDSDSPTSAEAYVANCREALTRVRKALPDCQIILLEPFLLSTDPAKRSYYEDLGPKILALRKLAREFGCAYVPLDGIFAEEETRCPAEVLSFDGVHPDVKGQAVIAREWLKRVT